MAANAISPDLRGYAKSHNASPPRHLGQRYDANGAFLPEPGNTVVCHLTADSETERALADARAQYLCMPEADRLAITPLSSLHMTLFQGIIEYRRSPEYWPAGMSLDTPIDATLPTGLVLEGATKADRENLKVWRDRLADLFGYRHPDHDDYVFHITFAYMIDWLSEEVLERWQTMLQDIADDIRRRAPVLELKPPAFCAFKDMNHFEELVVLPVQN